MSSWRTRSETRQKEIQNVAQFSILYLIGSTWHTCRIYLNFTCLRSVQYDILYGRIPRQTCHIYTFHESSKYTNSHMFYYLCVSPLHTRVVTILVDTKDRKSYKKRSVEVKTCLFLLRFCVALSQVQYCRRTCYVLGFSKRLHS